MIGERIGPLGAYLIIMGVAIAICVAIAITIGNYEGDK